MPGITLEEKLSAQISLWRDLEPGAQVAYNRNKLDTSLQFLRLRHNTDGGSVSEHVTEPMVMAAYRVIKGRAHGSQERRTAGTPPSAQEQRKVVELSSILPYALKITERWDETADGDPRGRRTHRGRSAVGASAGRGADHRDQERQEHGDPPAQPVPRNLRGGSRVPMNRGLGLFDLLLLNSLNELARDPTPASSPPPPPYRTGANSKTPAPASRIPVRNIPGALSSLPVQHYSESKQQQAAVPTHPASPLIICVTPPRSRSPPSHNARSNNVRSRSVSTEGIYGAHP